MAIKTSPEKIAQVVELRSQGRKYLEIASELGMGVGTVWHILNPNEKYERVKARRKEFRTLNVLSTVVLGQRVKLKVKKRPKPNICELCEEPPRGKRARLHWHHWDDEHPEYGLWLCLRCHNGAGFIEKGLLERYLSLKEEVVHAT